MIPLIVTSKDRAAQTHALLSSLKANGPQFKPTVLWAASDLSYRESYWTLEAENPDVEFITEANFHKDFCYLVRNQESDYIMFATDDDIMYRKPEIDEDELDTVFSEACCVSLRLGDNTTVQDTHRGTTSARPQMMYEYKDFLFWPWRYVHTSSNFAYPLSVDCHIFDRLEILDIIKQTEFHNPNSLECNWQKHLPSLRGFMASNRISSVVNTPLNRVQDTCQNLAGQFFGKTAEELNKDFRMGLRINFEGMDFSNIVGAHQELPIVYDTKFSPKIIEGEFPWITSNTME